MNVKAGLNLTALSPHPPVCIPIYNGKIHVPVYEKKMCIIEILNEWKNSYL